MMAVVTGEDMKSEYNRDLDVCVNMALARRKMNQSDLAREMEVTRAYVNKLIIHGRPSLAFIGRICNTLDITYVDLFKMGEM